MAHFKLVCTARKLTEIKKNLILEKENAVKLAENLEVNYTLGQRWRHCFVDIGLRLQRLWCVPAEGTRCYRFCYRLKHDGSFENFLLKSILGFIGGFFLTYLFFMFFVIQLNFKLSTATIFCSVFGIILILGLAFSPFIRCIVFLTLPQFFSKRGRQALLAYAFILAITGPAKNTLNNMGILSESLACGQEQLKQAVKQIIEVIKKPFYAIKSAIKTVIAAVKVIVKKIKEIFIKIKRIIMAVVAVIKAAFQFLARILNICNKELGTPFERCSRIFDNAVSDCQAKLGPLFSWLCSITYIVKSVCWIVKIFDFVCMLVDFISNSIIGVVIRKVKTFIRHVRTMFYVRIKFSHSFHFQTNSSKSYSEAAAGIVTEVKQRTQWMVEIFDAMTCATSFFFLFLIVKTLHYRFKFLTSERFDNKYITRNFREIDLQRAKFGKETVLPLNRHERAFYISIGSCRLVKTEKRKLSQSAVTLLGATLKLCSHMLVDYSLFWILNLIRYHARFQSKVQSPNLPQMHIEGDGLLADLLRCIVKAFKPLGIELEIDTIPCLPNPIPPDYDRYIQIATLLILCWILTIAEPHGLRLRHSIMCYYQPLRAKQRSIWLYNHIMRSRLTFLKFARRALRRTLLNKTDLAHVTCAEFLRARLRCRIFRCCLGEDLQVTCLLCGEVFRDDDDVKPIRCATPGCPGIYCKLCFDDLKNLCTVCLSPIEYGDLSDVSEEMGSDNDEPILSKKSHESGLGDEEESLLSGGDSGNESDSSGHSYSYQYVKEPKKVSTLEQSARSFRDIDDVKPQVRDYASMETFRSIEQEEFDKAKKKSISKLETVVVNEPQFTKGTSRGRVTSAIGETGQLQEVSVKQEPCTSTASGGFVQVVPTLREGPRRRVGPSTTSGGFRQVVPMLREGSRRRTVSVTTPKKKSIGTSISRVFLRPRTISKKCKRRCHRHYY